MNGDHATYDETVSEGGTMIRLNFRAWIMAPQFEYLNRAPSSEAETCDTMSPDAIALERNGSNGRPNKKFVSTAFSNFDDLKNSVAATDVLFFHVFERNPSEVVLKLLSEGDASECTLLLDVGNDLGFLKNTPITVADLADRSLVSKPLAELRSLGALAKGAMFGFEENEAAMGSFISKARAFVNANR